MQRLKILVIVEAANPDWPSVPLVGWSMVSALRELADVHFVTHTRNQVAIEKHGLIEGTDFSAIDSEALAKPLWWISEKLRGGKGKGWTMVTALSGISYYYFEYLFWRRFGQDIAAGKYDIVHRITPLSPTTPSLVARKCLKVNVPFILGPLNGGVPWPKAFDRERRQEREWLSYARSAYKLLPGYGSTLASSSAIIVGSESTYSEIPERFKDKCLYLPENGIDPKKFFIENKTQPARDVDKLRVCFVGRLVPYKGPDMLLEAALPLLKSNRIHLDIVGDGPLMDTLKDTIQSEGITDFVRLHGWVDHAKVTEILRDSMVFGFPSIREFGGGAVLEAMAMGLVPVVVDYGGPGELVTSGVGYKIPIGSRKSVVSAFRLQLQHLAENTEGMAEIGCAARARVSHYFTWEKKAQQLIEIYRWVLDKSGSEKPVLFA